MKRTTFAEIGKIMKSFKSTLVLSLLLGSVGVTFITSHVHAAESCRTVFLDTNFTYPPVLRKIQPDTPHTIENMDGYLRSKLGEEAVNEVANPNVNYVVIKGAAKLPLEQLDRKDIQSVTELSNAFGAFNTTKVTYKNGQASFVFSNVNGKSRYLQVLSFLRMAKVDQAKINIRGNLTSYRPLYTRTFKSIGHVPDLVVFGFANTSFEAIVESFRPQNMEALLAKNNTYAEKKWVKPRFDQHELMNMGVQVLEFKNGKKVWLIDNEYGDRATAVVAALREVGAKDVLLLGTAGSLNDNYSVGDIVSPKYFIQKDGEALLSNTTTPAHTKQGRHVHVDSPAMETKQWLLEQLDRGVDFVDVELQKASTAINDQMYYDAYLVISDVINSKNPSDYTKWNDQHRKNTKDKLSVILNASLQRVGVSREQAIESYKIKYFDTDKGGQ